MCSPYLWDSARPGGRTSAKLQALRLLHLHAQHAAVPRIAARAVCRLPARRHFTPGLWPHHRFAVSFPIDFKFYYWLLEHLRTRGFPSPSICLFPVEGMSFTIFIRWLVPSPSACTWRYPWLALGQVWETGLTSSDICGTETLCS